MLLLLLACAPKAPDFDAWRFAPYPHVVVPTGGPSSTPAVIPDAVFSPDAHGAVNLADTAWTLDTGEELVLRADGVLLSEGQEVGRWSQVGDAVTLDLEGRSLVGAVLDRALVGPGWSAGPTPPAAPVEPAPEPPGDGG